MELPVVGQTFKNYLDLCRFLGEPVKTGGARINQYKRWSHFFTFTKNGHSFYITETYPDAVACPSRTPFFLNETTCAILLTKQQQVIFDSVDLPLLSGYSFYYNRGYAVCVNEKGQIRMHRLILSAPADLVVDHINGDRLDNRRENLRLVTSGQNSRNRTIYKGIRGLPGYRKHHASITRFGEKIDLGRYDTEAEARAAYRAARIIFNDPLPEDQ